ncbi:TetR/AcrR family transcriptional regulator [Macrococcus hajekii]|uniref:TetR/AcrR family transcriptional regulator n=1 Tax=Macrococcus hajekii TaxID=198482 RepID=A0A4R6BK76_9STAP|nr:TetR/AcrR family transcriptional regulator [Macrococcus hajekii]TDM01971.1 TetR/AcrR family transcriptional regulator [Macrococcus hajekii]GGB08955.1 TetR family transcriptional regulator [Macrococcus hajekii]
MEDRRVRKTKESIKNAYFNLLTEKPFKDITINQITEKADINRGTFYLHYLDKFDLRDQLEGEIMAELEETLSQHDHQQVFRDPEKYSTQLIAVILQVIINHKDFFSVTLIHQDLGLPQLFSRIVRKHIQDNINLPDKLDIVPIEYYFAFIVNAQTGLIKEWVKNGMKESKEDIAKYAFAMAYNGPLKLMHEYLKEEQTE